MACRTCETLKSTRNKVYEDELVFAYLQYSPAAIGHMVVAPKAHAPIIEAVPDETLKRLFHVANKLSAASFEALGAMGTNILINNGLAAGQEENHVLVHVIPRRENDNLNLSWQPKQMSDEELSTAELQISEAEKQPTPQKPVILDTKPVEADDYLIRSLRRIP
jgi:histidine triad (HIT) family protein